MKLKIICNYELTESQRIEFSQTDTELLKTIVKNVIIDNPKVEIESVEIYD